MRILVVLVALLVGLTTPTFAAQVANSDSTNHGGVRILEWHDLDVTAAPTCRVWLTQASEVYVFVRGTDASGGTCTAWWRARQAGGSSDDDIRLEWVLSTDGAADAPSVDLAAAAFTDATNGSYAMASVNASLPVVVPAGTLDFIFTTTGGGPYDIFAVVLVPVIH